MAQLAIKGHQTRGKEVIEILEMLGGKNDFNLFGDASDLYYYINNDNKITYTLCNINGDFKIFTIEEFFEKYPYKIGDVVMLKGDIVDGKRFTINHMFWNGENVKYDGVGVDNPRNFYSCSACRLLPYKNETMEERKYSDLRLDVDQDDKLSTEVTIGGDKITPPENYLIGKVTMVDNGMLVEFVKKQPQYPRTYNECVNMFNGTVETVNLATLKVLRELIYCRNAYWKIAGEQMGLGKPWEPDWSNNLSKYYISFYNNKVDKGVISYSNEILAFPTEEMCDAFYENFKELIEKCKELL